VLIPGSIGRALICNAIFLVVASKDLLERG
jgi:hypothetical protein